MAESRAPWPKRGLAGKTAAAKNHAPEGATDMEILSVGWTAYQEGRDVEDVWQEVNGHV